LAVTIPTDNGEIRLELVPAGQLMVLQEMLAGGSSPVRVVADLDTDVPWRSSFSKGTIGGCYYAVPGGLTNQTRFYPCTRQSGQGTGFVAAEGRPQMKHFPSNAASDDAGCESRRDWE
jgi:hypothetical protein